MDVKVLPLEKVLAESRCFMVPIYQRNYRWGEDRIGPLWEDTTDKAENLMQGDHEFSHYLGALIIEPIIDSFPVAKTPRVHIVDGQQRLTSILLLLLSIREVARKFKLAKVMQAVNKYLTQDLNVNDTDNPNVRFKLVPSVPDREIFQFFVDNSFEEVKEKYSQMYLTRKAFQSSPQILQSYDYFYWSVHKFVENLEFSEDIDSGKPEISFDFEARLELLLHLLLSKVEVVLITLEPKDDPQIIFESLNDKSEKLLAMDLVRNSIFLRANNENDENDEKISIDDLYTKYWEPFNDIWWSANSANARPKRPRIDHFLFHILVAESGKKVSIRKLFTEYKDFLRTANNLSNVTEELKLLNTYAPYFETLEQRKCDDASLVRIGKKFEYWQVTTTYPIVFQIMNSNLEKSEKDTLLNQLYSYVVRRKVCGLTGKSYNKVFQSLANHFLNEKSPPSIAAFRDFFESRKRETVKFPDDDAFRKGILTSPIYLDMNGEQIKDLLFELDIANRHPQSEKFEMRSDGLQIEHVLPKKWHNYPFPEKKWYEGKEGTKDEIRGNAIHTIGNLTLITGKLNSAASNRRFDEKRDLYFSGSLFPLNRYFEKEEINKWDERDIQQRGEELAKLAIKIWQKPK